MALGDVEQDARNKRRWYEKARTSAEEAYKDEQKSLEDHAKSALSESQAKKDLDNSVKALRELDR
jgi:hypothetical protein